MNAYLVRNDADHDLWIAIEKDGRLWVYLPNTGDFRVNRGLTVDWLFDRDLSYLPLSAEQASEHIAAGQIGRLDGHRHREALASLRAAESMPADDLVRAGAADEKPPRRSRMNNQTLSALATQIAGAAPGVWTTYRTYPPSKKASAHRAASDARRGRVKAFRQLQLDSQVVEQTDGLFRVELTRSQ